MTPGPGLRPVSASARHSLVQKGSGPRDQSSQPLPGRQEHSPSQSPEPRGRAKDSHRRHRARLAAQSSGPHLPDQTPGLLRRKTHLHVTTNFIITQCKGHQTRRPTLCRWGSGLNERNLGNRASPSSSALDPGRRPEGQGSREGLSLWGIPVTPRLSGIWVGQPMTG